MHDEAKIERLIWKSDELFFARVGVEKVTEIKRREENYGDHGLLWFDIFEGEKISASIAGSAVLSITFEVVP